MHGNRRPTTAVEVGGVTIGGCAPVVVQAMTDTPTADAEATARQALDLAEAGAELVRVTVDTDASAAAVSEISARLADRGCRVPLVGDFQRNGHQLLADHPDCARTLAKFRVNPGNIGPGDRGAADFDAICRVARDLGRAIRIGVNGGSLDPGLVEAAMGRNARLDLGLTSEQVIDNCMIDSALCSVDTAVAAGLGEDRIVVSCKVSDPEELIRIYRRLARETSQPLHLGLTEAGRGTRGLVWSAAAMGPLLADGIGDTIRVSLNPGPGGDRREEVRAARELLQALGIRRFSPSVTSCPGCGRTSAGLFRDLAARVDAHLEDRMPSWRERYPGVEGLKVAVMGCVVNGPGESKNADIGISLPGTGESPRCPVYIDGAHAATIEGDVDTLSEVFIELIDRHVAERYSGRD